MEVFTPERAETLHHALVGVMQEGALTMLPEGRILSCNDRFARMVKQPVNETVGLRLQKFFPEEERAAMERLLEQSELLGDKGDFYLQASDGSRLEVEVSTRALKLEEQDVFFVVVSDLKQRKEQEYALCESERRFRLLVDEAKDYAILMLDLDGRVTHWNAGAQRIQGYSREEILGHSFAQFYPTDDRAREKPSRDLAEAIAQGRYVEEGWRMRKSGARFWANVVTTALHDSCGDVICFSQLVRDMTERKRAEDWHSGRNRVLELIANRAPLETILGTLNELIETQSEGMLCSIWLADEDGRLRRCAAAGLPEGYVRRLDGLPITEQMGAFGRAASQRKTAVVSDILVDPQWADQGLAAEHGLRASWATPILSNEEQPLGVFAMYYREPRGPSAAERRMVEVASNLARVAIEQERAEKALRQSEERFRTAFASAAVGMALTDLGGHFQEVNPAYSVITGYSREELTRMDAFTVTHPEDLPRVREAVRQLLERKFPGFVVQKRLVAKGGGTVWAQNSVSLLCDPEGKPQHLLLITEDISQRKRAEEGLRRAKEYAENLIESANVMIIGMDSEAKVQFLNREAERLTGYGREELLERNCFEAILPKEVIPAVKQEFSRVLAGGAPGDFENAIVTKTGQERIISWRNNQIREGDRITGMLSFGIDITERRRAEEAVRRSETQLWRFIESAPVAIAMFDRQMRYLAASTRWLDYHGSGREVIGLSHYAVFPQIPERWKEVHRRALAGSVERSEEDIFVRLDGSVSCLMWEVRPWYLQEGEVGGIVIFTEDITQRKQAEEALQKSEAQLRELAEAMPQIVWRAGPHGELEYFNRRWFEYTGLSEEETFRSEDAWQSVVHPEDLGRVAQAKQNALQKGEIYNIEHRMRQKGDGYRWFLSRALPIRDESDRILRWFGTSTDIEDQKRAEELLEQRVAQRTAKLQETVGELEQFSYSITHDLRAPLRAIQGFASLLKEESAGQLSVGSQDYLARIMASTERMENLIRDSLNYGRILQIGMKLEAVDIGTLMREIVQSYPSLQPPHAEVRLEGEFPRVLGNDAALAQCVSNLLLNAVKFVLPGTLPRVRVWAERTGNWVRLWFEDNGIGIAKEAQGQIFEMFQQADKTFGGTGIGLAIVRKAAERMGGRVGLESQPGKGSRFWLELKRAD